jgi:cytochrome c peroxidase
MRIGVVVIALTMSLAVAAAFQFVAATSAQVPIKPNPIGPVEELGRLLFWDPILSGNRDVACASCHHPNFAWADGRALSLGTGSAGLGPSRRDITGGAIPVVRRNSPTILNVVFNGLDGNSRRRRQRQQFDGSVASVDQANAPMFWDSRLRSLEAQALEPIKAFEEMRGTAYPEEQALDTVVARLQAIPEYVNLFERAFGSRAVTAERLGQAIGAFERTLIAMNSPFDKFRAGDTAALNERQRRGMELFDRVGCDRCHEGVMFSDFDLNAEGVPEHPSLSNPDVGAGRFRFRTPTLRNVALTAPYMHNGTLATLEDVLRFYDNGRSENPNVSNSQRRQDSNGLPRLSRSFQRVDDMSESEMQDIVAFLEALTDPNFDRTIPARVPSGLQPGGLIHDSRIRRTPA